MAEILHFPRTAPRPALRLVGDVDDLVAAELKGEGLRHIAAALDHMASANCELIAVNRILLSRQDDVTDLVSEETIIGLCHALISVIDAKGCRNDDRPLRNAAAKAIAEREGVYHGN
ncbi:MULTISPECIES: hypothetical protein [unclassified Rhizobium]|uniref:hypothetical protein n=1 Tax=unclassified Rhizobium TaxID=2613769 RepID=UPI0016227E8D|nr:MULTISPECIES: hypothetical protein [unclassified Rhizobium]MBB3297857.1 hypothetical protein [Rhizobium sp. BK112]MBB4177648.1 hypothetical protein [Rhizobium sp. BK109]